MIEVQGVTKKFGSKQVLSDVSFTARNGRVTGFLGPNGAGKSTTMRIIVDLVHPNSGLTLVDGAPYQKLPAPMASVGAVLDAKAMHRNRSAYASLCALAATNNIPTSRVDTVLEMTGLTDVKKHKAGSFSLGMSQRLSIAAALLGDPANLILDEPVNGLDPEGVRWVRELCRTFAREGRAVLLSSHLMSEVALTADDLVIIGQGRILQTTTVDDFVAEHSDSRLRITTPEPDRLYAIFAQATNVRITRIADQDNTPTFTIDGAHLSSAAQAFAQSKLVIYELIRERASLEQAYMELTHASAQYIATVPSRPGRHAHAPQETSAQS